MADVPQWVIDLYESRHKKTNSERPRVQSEDWEAEVGGTWDVDAAEKTTEYLLQQARDGFQDIMDRGWSAQWDNEVTRIMGILVRLVNSPWSEFDETDLDKFLANYAPEDEGFGAREHERIKNSCFRMADGEILDMFESNELTEEQMEIVMKLWGQKAEEKVVAEDKRTDIEGPLATIPDEFWEARPLFAGIRQHAWHRIASPDATLHSFLAAYAARVPYLYELETGVGTPAKSLFFSCIAAESGEGKGTATALGFKLAKNDMPALPMGTGEGLVEAFLELQVDMDNPANFKKDPKTGDEVLVANPSKKKVQVNHNLLISETEGSSFVAIMERPQSLLSQTILKMAVGEDLGQSNAYAESSRYVPERSYSAGMVVGVQYEGAGHILARHGVGLSQRFFWTSVIDPNAKDVPEVPAELSFHEPLPTPFGWGGLSLPVQVQIDPAITAPMRQARVNILNGSTKVDPQDSHRDGLCLRLALVLRMLDGPNLGVSDEHGVWKATAYQVTTEDWRLANILYDTSKKVRTQLVSRAAKLETVKVKEQGQKDAVRRVAASETEADIRGAEAKSKTLLAVDKVVDKGMKPLASNIKVHVTKSYRPMVDETLVALVVEGELAYNEETKEFTRATLA